MSRRIIHALGFGHREFSLITLSSAAVFVALQVFIGNLTRRGLDLTDEGYYMNSIHWADHYQAGVSGFGDFYGILYVSLGQDFGALREINSWLSWVLWSILGWFFVQYMVIRGGLGPEVGPKTSRGCRCRIFLYV